MNKFKWGKHQSIEENKICIIHLASTMAVHLVSPKSTQISIE